MLPFVDMTEMGHEQVVFCHNKKTGLKAIIAIHDTTLGPALGGCRLYDYKSADDALRDVLRLSRGMTYKAAISGLDLGGGKSVILGNPGMKSEAFFRSFGRQIESLGGRYITAEDMNTTVSDMNHIRKETAHVTGIGARFGGSGNPSPVTAWGVFNGIRATLEIAFGSPSVEGRTIAIQGLGNVGRHLARYISERGGNLIYSDINGENVKKAIAEFGGTAVESADYYSTKCDVLAPCAIGGIINKQTIPTIQAPIIAGGANNVLDDEVADGERLAERGIIFAPDYVINAGGLMSVYAELKQWPHETAMENAGEIFSTTKMIIEKARSESITSIMAANQLAQDRIEAVAQIKRLHVGG
jgi:leucine dehydrogenase